MSWDLARQQCAAARAAVFGKTEPGVYTPPGGGAGVPVTVRLRFNAEVLGDFGEVIERRTEMKLLVAEISARRNATVFIEGIDYDLATLLEDTGVETRWAVKRSS